MMSLCSCKKNEQKRNSMIVTSNNIVGQTNFTKDCANSFYIENGIPQFNFEVLGKEKNYRKSFLIDTLFRHFSYHFIIREYNQKAEYQRHTLAFFKPNNTQNENVVPSTLFNTFEFYNIKKNHYILSYVELNFSTKQYKKYIDNNYFKIYKDNVIIDIELSKKEFSKIFKEKTELLCDTVKIGDEFTDSWYLFKNNRLNKIIINPYID